mmetsp:Transcript_41559/g.99640  ORF Transcript_41559/g.99640 Transcript_41559/m.99640 type:complete len:80 (+) Transcript_41559:325-564(+)
MTCHGDVGASWGATARPDTGRGSPSGAQPFWQAKWASSASFATVGASEGSDRQSEVAGGLFCDVLKWCSRALVWAFMIF